jgi:DNA (cytosine-5)-methyltransferase 1
LISGFRKDLNIKFDLSKLKIKDRNPNLKNILEDKVDDEYFISKKLWNYLKSYKEKHRKKGNGFGYSIADKNDVTRTMSARYYKDGSEILINDGKDTPRMLTEKEASRLFGFQEEYKKSYGKEFKIPVSKTQAYQQFGNSVCVPLVRIIAENMIEALFNNKTNDRYEHHRNCNVINM